MIDFADSSAPEVGNGKPQSSPADDGRPAWHERYLAILPDIRRQARKWLSRLPVPFREEAEAEVVARTVVAYARLVELDKEHLGYATPLARYAMMQYRSGRRVGTGVKTGDVLSPVCGRKNGCTVRSLDGIDANPSAWREAITDRRSYTPADAGALRADFDSWLRRLTKRDRGLAVALASGETTTDAARRLGITAGRVSQLRRKLHGAWQRFQSES
jgi:hypothetical protein